MRRKARVPFVLMNPEFLDLRLLLQTGELWCGNLLTAVRQESGASNYC